MLTLCLLLCGCGAEKTPATGTTPTTLAPTTAPNETTEPTQEVTVPTEPEDVDPPPPVEPAYRHPLTGAALDAPFTGRPVAVSIGNTTAALPQYGISMADVFVELETEDGITRFLTIFTDFANVDSIGPVRSVRSSFNNIAAAYNAPVVHCGGSYRGLDGYYDLTGPKIPNWQHINESVNGNYFFRDYDRYKTYAWEHCLFTTGEKMLQALTDKGYQSNQPWELNFQFGEAPALEGSSATKVTVSFRAGKTSSFVYDAATDTYAMSQYGGPLIDGGNNKQLTFKNLIVLYADQTIQWSGTKNRSYYDLIGEGEGYFAVNGKIVKILWSREDVNAPFVYTYPDGTPITLGVGQTYIAISSTRSKDISYE